MPTLIPFGDRVLVKRRKVGSKAGKSGVIELPDNVADKETELADVVYVPEHSFADAEMISSAKEIIESTLLKAKQGDSDALLALLRFNEFIKIKSIQPGDVVMIHKYVGTSFNDNTGASNLTLVNGSDIIAIVKEVNTA
ncbi:MAG: hypothetical protein KKE30_01740 [Gammaproteobacteria bacterium]|nr:hypothetical protein [Gammaproteobacteria bacterium]